jgi:hypothetical protein
MKSLVFFLISFLGTSAFGNTLGAYHGKLVEVTEKDIGIEVKAEKTVYYIKKSALSKRASQLISKIGRDITVSVPIEAVDGIREEK